LRPASPRDTHLTPPILEHEKTDLFRSKSEYSRAFKERLAAARQQGLAAVREVAADPALANLTDTESGIVVDLFLSLRAVEAHQDMLDLYQRMPPPLQRTRMVQEQRGFALNRLRRRDEAEQVLKQLINDFGPSSETNGLLGRVYKDRWEDARKAGDQMRARIRGAAGGGECVVVSVAMAIQFLCLDSRLTE